MSDEEVRQEMEKEGLPEGIIQERLEKIRVLYQEIDRQAKDKIVCISVFDNQMKQCAMVYMFKKGFVCLQNSFAHNNGFAHEHILTFVDSTICFCFECR